MELASDNWIVASFAIIYIGVGMGFFVRTIEELVRYSVSTLFMEQSSFFRIFFRVLKIFLRILKALILLYY